MKSLMVLMVISDNHLGCHVTLGGLYSSYDSGSWAINLCISYLGRGQGILGAMSRLSTISQTQENIQATGM